MDKIDRRQFPQLDSLLWDTKARFINQREVLDIYERRWPFVDQGQLCNKERQLINVLAQQAGGFLPVPV